MESDRQSVETEGVSTPLTERTEDDHGEHQLETSVGESGENQTEATNSNAREEAEGIDANTEKSDTVSNEEIARKGALTKKEERLKRLRELHLRRVRTFSQLLYISIICLGLVHSTR